VLTCENWAGWRSSGKTSTGPSHNWKPACSWPSASTTRLARRACSITWAGLALYRGEREAAAGKQAAALKLVRQAAEYLDWAVGTYKRLGLAVPEGRARKYVALTRLHDGKIEEAEEHLHRGEEFAARRRPHAGCGRGTAFHGPRPPGPGTARRSDAPAAAGAGAVRFAASADRGDADSVRAGQAMAEAKAPGRLVVRACRMRFQRAEACRRGELVARIEESLKGHRRGGPLAAHSSAGSRPRRAGRHDLAKQRRQRTGIDPELELVDFESYCQGLDPEGSLNTLNQLLAELEGILDRSRAQVLNYLAAASWPCCARQATPTAPCRPLSTCRR